MFLSQAVLQSSVLYNSRAPIYFQLYMVISTVAHSQLKTNLSL